MAALINPDVSGFKIEENIEVKFIIVTQPTDAVDMNEVTEDKNVKNNEKKEDMEEENTHLKK